MSENDLKINDDLWGAVEDFKIYQKKKIPKGSVEDAEKCFNCGSDEMVSINSEYICNDCGTINSNLFDFNAEWRYYGFDDSKYSDP